MRRFSPHSLGHGYTNRFFIGLGWDDEDDDIQDGKAAAAWSHYVVVPHLVAYIGVEAISYMVVYSEEDSKK